MKVAQLDLESADHLETWTVDSLELDWVAQLETMMVGQKGVGRVGMLAACSASMKVDWKGAEMVDQKVFEKAGLRVIHLAAQ